MISFEGVFSSLDIEAQFVKADQCKHRLWSGVGSVDSCALGSRNQSRPEFARLAGPDPFFESLESVLLPTTAVLQKWSVWLLGGEAWLWLHWSMRILGQRGQHCRSSRIHVVFPIIFKRPFLESVVSQSVCPSPKSSFGGRLGRIGRRELGCLLGWWISQPFCNISLRAEVRTESLGTRRNYVPSTQTWCESNRDRREVQFAVRKFNYGPKGWRNRMGKHRRR